MSPHRPNGYVDLVPQCLCGRSGYPHLITMRPDLDWSAERAVLEGTSLMAPMTQQEAVALSGEHVFCVGDLAVVGDDSTAAGSWGEVPAVDWITTSTGRWVQQARVRFVWPGSSTERQYRFRARDLEVV